MTTDPRFVRSADALRDAILALTAERPVERISVTEVARRAGVTRATFYNHATSPATLLTGTLEAELDAIQAGFLVRAEQDPQEVESIWRASELELIEHIERHGAVYRAGLAPVEGAHGSVLAHLLAGHIERGLSAYLEQSPAADDGATATRMAMAAAFVSLGTVGALRAWLESPEPHDPQFAADTILDLIPRLWFAVGQA